MMMMTTMMTTSEDGGGGGKVISVRGVNYAQTIYRDSHKRNGKRRDLPIRSESIGIEM